MDFENERYVRIYTRDTATLLAVGWEGRAVLWEMIRKADRSGVIDGDLEMLPDLLRIPREVVTPGIERLIKRGVVEIGPSGFVIPNFLEAQEARQSDKQRQRESRAKRRALARLDGATVTKRDATDQKPHDTVTPGHVLALDVTPSLAEPIQPSRESRARAHVASPVPPPLDPRGEVVTEDEQAILAELQRSPSLAHVADLETARAVLMHGAGKPTGELVSRVRYVSAQVTARTASGGVADALAMLLTQAQRPRDHLRRWEEQVEPTTPPPRRYADLDCSTPAPDLAAARKGALQAIAAVGGR